MLQAHNLSVTPETPNEGERIALRRKRLGWKQDALAANAGVGITTVVQIEKDRSVTTEKLRAVLAALEKGEKKKAGARDPIRHSTTTQSPSAKEGVDAATKLREARSVLQHAEVLLLGALETVRRGLADLDDDTIEQYRKSG